MDSGGAGGIAMDGGVGCDRTDGLICTLDPGRLTFPFVDINYVPVILFWVDRVQITANLAEFSPKKRKDSEKKSILTEIKIPQGKINPLQWSKRTSAIYVPAPDDAAASAKNATRGG